MKNVGSRNGSAKLTEAIVLEIRDRRRRGESLAHLARTFGVNVQTVYSICCGHSWRHLPGAVPPMDRRCSKNRGSANWSAKLDEQKVVEMRARYLRGEHIVHLAKEFGVSHEVASFAIHGRTWRHVPGAVKRAPSGAFEPALQGATGWEAA